MRAVDTLRGPDQTLIRDRGKSGRASWERGENADGRAGCPAHPSFD